MIGLLIPIISKIIDSLVQGGQLKAEEAQAAQQALQQAQVQRDVTFGSFIQNTSNIIYTIMRNVIVGVFAASLVVPHWGQAVAANAAAMPVYFWLIIGWEFYGDQALSLIPWVRGGGNTAQNGGGGVIASSLPVSSLPSEAPPTLPPKKAVPMEVGKWYPGEIVKQTVGDSETHKGEGHG